MNIVEPSDSRNSQMEASKELNDIERDKCDNVINYTRQNETLEDWKGMLEVVQRKRKMLKIFVIRLKLQEWKLQEI